MPKNHRRKRPVRKGWPFQRHWFQPRIRSGAESSNKALPRAVPTPEGTPLKSRIWRRCRIMPRTPLRPTPLLPTGLGTIHSRSIGTAVVSPQLKGRPTRFGASRPEYRFSRSVAFGRSRRSVWLCVEKNRSTVRGARRGATPFRSRGGSGSRGPDGRSRWAAGNRSR